MEKKRKKKMQLWEPEEKGSELRQTAEFKDAEEAGPRGAEFQKGKKSHKKRTPEMSHVLLNLSHTW